MKTTYRVRAWNTYAADGTGAVVVAADFEARTVTDAMDQAVKVARKWRHVNPAMRINFLSCDGFVRAVN